MGYIIPLNSYKMPLFTIKQDPSCRGRAVEPLCHGKRCGFSTICILNEILLTIQMNLQKKGMPICQRIKVDDLVLPPI